MSQSSENHVWGFLGIVLAALITGYFSLIAAGKVQAPWESPDNTIHRVSTAETPTLDPPPALPAVTPVPSFKELGPQGSFNFGAISPESTLDDVISIYGTTQLKRKRSGDIEILSYVGAASNTIVAFNCDSKTHRVLSVQIFDAEDAKQFKPYFNQPIEAFVSFAGQPTKVSREDPTVMLQYDLRNRTGRRGTMVAQFFADKVAPRLYSVFLDWNPK